MPTPANREDVRRFLGVLTYLSKFIPNMSLKSAPLCQLLQKDVEWSCEQVEDDAFTSLKTSISSAPVLKFFEPKEPVTLSVDASSKGVGAVLLQNDRPAAYASKALTPSLENYAQMEKEMLAIVFGTCQQHQRSNQREPLIPQEVPERAWATVAADIFYYKGKDYLLVVDYFSKYPEVARLSGKNSEAVILAMKDMFARHGILERLIADNMPFNTVKFKDFAKFRNSPISGMNESPAELLMSRKLRTRLPISKSLLEPQPRSTSQILHNLLTRQQRQKALYDRGTRPLSTLHEEVPVRMKQGREWTPAMVIRQHQIPRSYIVATPDGTKMRRNRFHLQSTKEEASPVPSPAPSPAWVAGGSDESNPSMQPSTDTGIETSEMEAQPDFPQKYQPVRRSLRVHRPPARLIETA
ncbi:Transposon Tf2-9 polyprotein [Stylophora pistillata]|uniref:Transposon Tf2-9 polyprotein n=1 Tax=Stylophora pistillata TaxID=50429 RepID=A0A2B4SYH7_STYPI|nr:Transposon Tf2-9 polyprotein [Stylophora pistillata]